MYYGYLKPLWESAKVYMYSVLRSKINPVTKKRAPFPFKSFLKGLFLAFFMASLTLNASAQLDKRMNLPLQKKSVKELLAYMEEKAGLVFVYSDLSDELSKFVSPGATPATAENLLRRIEQQTSLHFTASGNYITIKFIPKKENTGKASITGIIVDQHNGNALSYATVILRNEKDTLKTYSSVAGSDGRLAFSNIPVGNYIVRGSYVGYKQVPLKILLQHNSDIKIEMAPVSQEIQEIKVTATEEKGMTSSSMIKREAIDLLQPSSFTDILSLLPGGKSSAPILTSPNTIRLREADPPSGSNYAISSLGTLFVIDDIPISTDANRQRIDQSSNLVYVSNKEFANFGTDMRGISTDNIESVEIIRGIPSVKYGDLTSGVVKIDRKQTPSPFSARFKMDQFSKLFSVSKGFHESKKDWTVNMDIDYLDGKRNPIDPMEIFNRYTLSARVQKGWKLPEGKKLRWNFATDYTGQFDDWKNDVEQMLDKEIYKLDYNNFGFTSRLNLVQPKSFLRSLDFNTNIRYSQDKIYRERWPNNAQLGGIIPVSMDPGEQDAFVLPDRYLATVTVDGKPFNIFSTLRATSEFKTSTIKHKAQAGLEWRMDKNYGKGQVFDMARPVSNTFDSRPYPYDAVPANEHASYYIEDHITFPELYKNKFSLQAGLRGGTMLNLDKRYLLQGKFFTDPRLNLQWNLPQIYVADKPLMFTLTGGLGWLTKMPTMSMLHPDLLYQDFVQFKHTNTLRPELSRYNLMTYVEDLTNYDLSYARNKKQEIRFDAEWKGHQFSVTWFSEKMSSGFRSFGQPKAYSHKKYDLYTGDPNQMPDLSQINYTTKNVFRTLSYQTNGSRLDKDGVELTFTTPRYPGIETRFTVTGAYFKNNYTNSQPLWYRGSAANNPQLNGFIIFDNYAALYPNWRDDYLRKRTSGTVTADTYVKRLGLTLSLSADIYIKGSNYLWNNNPGAPSFYLTTDGTLHPYTEADKQDIYLSYLVLPVEYAGLTVDNKYEMHGHLRASKDFGKWLRLSMYALNFADYNKGYHNLNGVYTRNSNSAAYFGMELRLTL